jgi:hypothetical protein
MFFSGPNGFIRGMSHFLRTARKPLPRARHPRPFFTTNLQTHRKTHAASTMLLLQMQFMKLLADTRNAAFTVGELFAVLVSVSVLILFLLHSITKCGGKGLRVKCTGGLKQLALGFQLWAEEHETGFPMEVSESKGGTRQAALAGKLLPNLLIISNQLRTPSILTCPEDRKRKPVTAFFNLTALGVSYFLNVDAALTNQNHVIVGDRNLAMADSPVTPGLLKTTNANDLTWTKALHEHGGNVALVDGSAHQVTTKGLRNLLTLGGPTNRLIIP